MYLCSSVGYSSDFSCGSDDIWVTWLNSRARTPRTFSCHEVVARRVMWEYSNGTWGTMILPWHCCCGISYRRGWEYHHDISRENLSLHVFHSTHITLRVLHHLKSYRKRPEAKWGMALQILVWIHWNINDQFEQIVESCTWNNRSVCFREKEESSHTHVHRSFHECNAFIA